MNYFWVFETASSFSNALPVAPILARHFSFLPLFSRHIYSPFHYFVRVGTFYQNIQMSCLLALLRPKRKVSVEKRFNGLSQRAFDKICHFVDNKALLCMREVSICTISIIFSLFRYVNQLEQLSTHWSASAKLTLTLFQCGYDSWKNRK